MSGFADRYAISTDPLRTERRVELMAVILLMLLVLQVLWGGYSVIFRSAPEPVLPAPESLQVGSVMESEQVTPEQREQIRERPVFWASRQPTENGRTKAEREAAAKQKEKKPGKISGVKLTGVFGAGDSAGIIVLSKGEKRRVMIGEKVGDWTLKSVTPVEAKFRNNGEKASLQLDRGELISSEPLASAPEEKVKAGKKAEQASPESPGILGLGGGDRNRKKTRK